MKKILGNKKAISTILAALLMVVIVVVASVMVYAWSTGLLGTLLVQPHTGQENLSLENFAFTGTTVATLSIRNIGSVTTNLVTYYVKDSSSNTYASTPTAAFTSPTTGAPPNTILTATITVGPTCPSTCTYNGASTIPSGAFQFTTGSWEITVITAQNQQFKFPINK